jgi:hypothetical protein
MKPAQARYSLKGNMKSRNPSSYVVVEGTERIPRTLVATDATHKKIPGCVDYSKESGNCTKCNQYSLLDPEFQVCFCQFEYSVSVVKQQQGQPVKNKIKIS